MTTNSWRVIDRNMPAHRVRIVSNSEPIADMWQGHDDDANLIVAAVNACKKVNPQNPLAAAEALPELLQSLKDCLHLLRTLALVKGGNPEDSKIYSKAQSILAKAEATK